MQHQGTKRLESERLILRRFRIEDAKAAFNNWVTDPEVTKFLTWAPHADIEVTKNFLREWIGSYEKNDFYQWAITLKEKGDEPIGTISVVQKDDKIKMVHIGYCIGKKWWMQGITSEAFKTLIHFFFQEVKVNRIESRHDPRNPNSGKVMQKCGLKYEGTRREADWSNQGICDSVHYAVLAKDYFSL